MKDIYVIIQKLNVWLQAFLGMTYFDFTSYDITIKLKWFSTYVIIWSKQYLYSLLNEYEYSFTQICLNNLSVS